MRTSIDVFNKLRWDGEYDQENYTIGYRNFNLTVEIKVANWVPQAEGGEIPWHRVIYYKDTRDNTIMWHKTKRIDGFFNTGDNPTYVDNAMALKSFANVTMKPWTYNETSDSWSSSMPYSINDDTQQFSIITWNILSHEFTPDQDNHVRYQDICDTLGSGDYAIICLQEVTPMFLTILRQQQWVRDYWISDCNGASFDQTMGIVTMSRIPCKQVYMLCDTKNSLITEFMICGYNLKVVNLHLTSNAHGDASERRRAMLERLGRITTHDLNCIWVVTGDFNSDHNNVIKLAPWLKNYERCCVGHTFCPSENSQVKIHSKSKEDTDRQIDHMYITSDMGWHLLDHGILKQELSDHYAVHVRLELYQGAQSGDTCMVIVPPLEYWPVLLGDSWISQSCQPGDFDRLKRWVPHVSLLLGYYAADSQQYSSKDIAATLEIILKAHFQLTFDTPDQFKSRQVLKPAPGSPTLKLLQQLESNLRELCSTATRHLYEGVYTPHLTLPDAKPTEPTVITWPLSQVYVDVKHKLMFEHHEMFGSIPVIDVDKFLTALRTLFPEIIFQTIGSRLYLDDTNSDLDVIAYSHCISQDEFYDRILWIGRNCGYFEHVYVTDSKIKIAKLFNPDIGHVDLQYIECTPEQYRTCPSTWRVAYNSLELVDRSRILVLQDNIYYNQILTETQKQLIRDIKSWAKRQRIYLNCVGYFSGIVVTVMVVTSGAQTVEQFFQYYKDFDFSKHTISESGFKPSRKGRIDSLMYVSSPIHPFNLNVKVTQSSIKWIGQALKTWQTNYEQPKLTVDTFMQSYPWTVINLKKLSHERAKCIEEYGRLVGRVVNVIVLLEQEYRVFTHVIEEDEKMYMFFSIQSETEEAKERAKELPKVINQWFRRNNFQVSLKFHQRSST